MSMRYYEIIEWKKICVEEEYNQSVEYTIAKTIKTTNVQQLACQAALNNFAVNIWPNFYVEKLMFLVK